MEEIESHQQKRDSFSNNQLSRSKSVSVVTTFVTFILQNLFICALRTKRWTHKICRGKVVQLPKRNQREMPLLFYQGILFRFLYPPGDFKQFIFRSLTFHNDSNSSLSNSFLGSKFNSLLKSTTIEMANKAKKLASNIAKDLNDTVQTNLAYYTPEKVSNLFTIYNLNYNLNIIFCDLTSSRDHCRIF